MLYLRITLNLLIFSSILFLPWWFTALAAIGFMFAFEAYEVLLWGLIADIYYGAPVPAYFNIEFLFTILFFILFAVIHFFKKKLLAYTR
jgi:hypothetical protein